MSTHLDSTKEKEGVQVLLVSMKEKEGVRV